MNETLIAEAAVAIFADLIFLKNCDYKLVQVYYGLTDDELKQARSLAEKMPLT